MLAMEEKDILKNTCFYPQFLHGPLSALPQNKNQGQGM